MNSSNRTLAGLLLGALLVSLLACQKVHRVQQKDASQLLVDYLIRHGKVFTGISSTAQSLTVGVCDQIICYLKEGSAPDTNIQAKYTIDATGLTVTPGFIDPHTHTLEELLSQDQNHNINYLTQGVTTVLTGNDGEGTPEIAELSAQLSTHGIGTNVGLLVGHNAIRIIVMGKDNRAPTANEMQLMKQLLKQALQEGALAFSTGLYYVPGIYSTTKEVIELTQVAAEFGVPYESHIRDESNFSTGFLNAIREFIEIIDTTQTAGHIAHIKALGVDVWGQSAPAIDLINQAIDRGLIITADQYPWQASGTFLHNAVIPKWALEGERPQILMRLAEPANHKKLMQQINENIRKRGGPDSLLITASQNPDWQGKYLSQIAENNQTSAAQMVLNMMQQETTRVASFNMSDHDINSFMQQDWVVTSSDGTDGHPRKFASFPKKYQHHVHNHPTITLAHFINNSSARTADIFGISNRGTIEIGMQADINVIDLSQFKAHADFSSWNKLSTGVVHQFINGQPSISHGQLSSLTYGQVVLNNHTPND